MKRSKHSLSHYHLLSCDMGELVPIGVTEVMPGDTIQQASVAMVRVSPMVKPIMHPVETCIHHWFVPYRLLWNEWEDFITGGQSGNSTPTFPHMNSTPILADGTKSIMSIFNEGSLGDYLGLPDIEGLFVSALPFRAYNLIYNENYRDQDLQDELAISYDGGEDTTTDYDLMNSNWRKDYFNTARTTTQKGDDVVIPLGDTAPIRSTGGRPIQMAPTANVSALETMRIVQQPVPEREGLGYYNATLPPATYEMGFGAGGRDIEALYTDLSSATGISVNDLRLALSVQRFKEHRQKYGSRYVEFLRYLGVTSSDARLQRPEYLGGGKQTLSFSEVLQTAPGADSAVGDLAGHGISTMRSNRYRKFFEEHGVIISLMTTRPKSMYMQGANRMWFKRSKEEYFHPEFQNIGQQEVYMGELYARPAGNYNEDQNRQTFGFQDRYDEYRRSFSRVSGTFRSTDDNWHMARQFNNVPALNSDFTTCVPTKRILADQVSDALQVMVSHNIQARRLVSKTAINRIV